VHPSRFGPAGDSPYIRREVDGLLTAALADVWKRVVIVEGPRLAGATSTLAWAAQSCLPDYLAAGFADDPRVPLADLIAQAGQWAAAAQARAAGAVVWLDGLSPGRFSELARVPLGDLPSGTWVLATLDTGELEGLRVPEQLNELMDRHAVRVRLSPITRQERRDLLAETVYAPLRPVLEQNEDLLLGRVMVAWEPVRAALAPDASEHGIDRVALHAVTDWHRAQLPRLLTPDILRYLYRAYHHELTGAAPDSSVSAAGLSDALQWASAPSAAGRPRLVDLQDVPGGQRYAPYSLLPVIADDPGEDVSWSVSDALWSYANRYFDGDQHRDIGYSALARGARHAAAHLLSHTDTTVDPVAYGQLADLFREHAEWADSRHWYLQAINTGHPDQAPKAMLRLGALEKMQGDLRQARYWWRQAISTGHAHQAPTAMFNLGLLEYEQGDLGQVRHWYLQAISTGHADWAPMAMVNLGALEHKQGHPGQARHWYHQAISTGHAHQAPMAMVNLWTLEREQGDFGQARHWWQRAISTGHPETLGRARRELRALDRHEGERKRGEQFGRYGYLAYADPALMEQARRSPETPAPGTTD
jgi:Tfp pilus assembly protein PilF